MHQDLHHNADKSASKENNDLIQEKEEGISLAPPPFLAQSKASQKQNTEPSQTNETGSQTNKAIGQRPAVQFATQPIAAQFAITNPISITPPKFSLSTANPSAIQTKKDKKESNQESPSFLTELTIDTPANPPIQKKNSNLSEQKPPVFQLKTAPTNSKLQIYNDQNGTAKKDSSISKFEIMSSATHSVQKKENESIEEKPSIQLKSTSSAGMDDDTLTQMSASFNTDFSNVNIHKDSSSAVDAGALAYTQGNDVHFAPGQYDPGTDSGKELLGHELTHVVQQREGRVTANNEVNGMPLNDDKGLEAKADEGGRKVVQRKSRNYKNSLNVIEISLIQRKEKKGKTVLSFKPEIVVAGQKAAQPLKAHDLIDRDLPEINISSSEIISIQKVLDAAIFNPEVEKEYMRMTSGIPRSMFNKPGMKGLTEDGSKKIDKADKYLKENTISILEKDKIIKLNYIKLLSKDALEKVTDIPEEEDFISEMKKILEKKEVWLNINSARVGFSKKIDALSNFRLFLTLGKNGDEINTKGSLTRSDLLSIYEIKRLFHKIVSDGKSMKKLKLLIDAQSDYMYQLRGFHMELEILKSDHPTVSYIVDSYPLAESYETWRNPIRYIEEAKKSYEKNEFRNSFQSLLKSMIATTENIKLIERWRGNAISGAQSAIKILEVAKFSGQVASAFIPGPIGYLSSGVYELASQSGNVLFSDGQMDLVKLAKETAMGYAASNSSKLFPGPGIQKILGNDPIDIATSVANTIWGTVTNNDTVNNLRH